MKQLYVQTNGNPISVDVLKTFTCMGRRMFVHKTLDSSIAEVFLGSPYSVTDRSTGMRVCSVRRVEDAELAARAIMRHNKKIAIKTLKSAEVEYGVVNK